MTCFGVIAMLGSLAIVLQGCGGGGGTPAPTSAPTPAPTPRPTPATPRPTPITPKPTPVPTPRPTPKPAPRELTNITIYRITPLNYTGVTNMDTGDAAGDAMFGLNNLLLPQLCPLEPDFVWCANRALLSGGNASMVYTEFTVETDTRFGEYNACNPDPDTGIFSCETMDGGSSDVPRQCAAGFELYHQDCLNGTVFANITTSSDWETAEGVCCAACTKAGAKCSGWNIGPSHLGNRTCQLLQGNTTDWEGAQRTHDCKAAVRDPREFACWYTDPEFNETFKGVCDPSKCACDVIQNRSVGREEHAMCWHHSQTAQGLQAGWGHHSKWFNYLGGLACLLDGIWYSTEAAGECSGSQIDDSCWWRLAQTKRTVNATCVDNAVITSVQKQRPACWTACPQATNRSSACWLECLFETMVGNTTKGIPPMSKEMITASFANAFKDEKDGGCPTVVCRSDADCKLAGDKTGVCEANGSCKCDAGFYGQFCTKTHVGQNQLVI